MPGVVIDDLEGMLEYQCGLWYSPCVKIFSIGGPNRIAEVSNYPRAYKDHTPHVYTEDVPFIVAESDLNGGDEAESVDSQVGDTRVYRDSRGKSFYVGEEAIHYVNDPLPGAFPLWIESEELPSVDLPFVPGLKHEFPILNIPGPIRDLTEAQQKVGTAFAKLPKKTITTMSEDLPTGKITLVRKPPDSDKQIIRIRYRRMF